MTTSKEKSVKLKASKSAIKHLINEFYNLRKSFEAGYSGQLRSHKYEDTREFTISLNFAIFQANQLLLNDDGTLINTPNLEARLAHLKQDFLDLIH